MKEHSQYIKELKKLDHVIVGQDASIFQKIEGDNGINCCIWENAVPQSVRDYFSSLSDKSMASVPRYTLRNAADLRLNLESYLPKLSGKFNAINFLGSLFAAGEAFGEGYETDIQIRYSRGNAQTFHSDGGYYRIVCTLNNPIKSDDGGDGSTVILPDPIAKEELQKLPAAFFSRSRFPGFADFEMSDKLFKKAIPLGCGNAAIFTALDKSQNNQDEKKPKFPLYHNSPNLNHMTNKRLRTFCVLTVRKKSYYA